MQKFEKDLIKKPSMIIKSLLSDHGVPEYEGLALKAEAGGWRYGIYAFSTPNGYNGQPSNYKFLVILSSTKILVIGDSACAIAALRYARERAIGGSDCYKIPSCDGQYGPHGEYKYYLESNRDKRDSYLFISKVCSQAFKGGGALMNDLQMELYVSLIGEDALLQQTFATYDLSMQGTSMLWYLCAFKHYTRYGAKNDKIFNVMLEALRSGFVYNAVYCLKFLPLKFSLTYFELLSRLRFVGFSRKRIALWVLRTSNECVIMHLRENEINGPLSLEIVSWRAFAKKFRNELVYLQIECDYDLIKALSCSCEIDRYVTLKEEEYLRQNMHVGSEDPTQPREGFISSPSLTQHSMGQRETMPGAGTTVESAPQGANTSSLGKRKMTVEPSEVSTQQGVLSGFRIQDGRIERWNASSATHCGGVHGVHTADVSQGLSGVVDAQRSAASLAPTGPDNHSAGVASSSATHCGGVHGVHTADVSQELGGVVDAQRSAASLAPKVPDNHSATTSFFAGQERCIVGKSQAMQGGALGSSNAYMRYSQRTAGEDTQAAKQSSWFLKEEIPAYESRAQGPNVRTFFQQGVLELECREKSIERPFE